MCVYIKYIMYIIFFFWVYFCTSNSRHYLLKSTLDSINIPRISFKYLMPRICYPWPWLVSWVVR